MVIEWLKFDVEPGAREKFIREDARIWTPFLASYDGFLGKEVWIEPQTHEHVSLIIRWQTRKQWKAIPQTVLDETEQKFAQAMGETQYRMSESLEYQVRKFSNDCL